jgi:hypothetical protein
MKALAVTRIAALTALALGSFATLGACKSDAVVPQTPGDITVAITSPLPGDELLASDSATIHVEGTIATTNPAYGVLVAYVNGVAVDVDDGGGFATDIAPVVGVNHIKVDGEDGFGSDVSQELDVMYAPEYLPPTAGTTAFALDGGLDLYLGQSFFDAIQLGTNLDLTTNPVIAHDLASALELILWNIDLASLLNGGINVGSGSSTLAINIPSATPSEIIVDALIVDAPDNEIDLSIDLDGVFLATTGTFHFNGTNLVVAGGLSADMHASARLLLGVNADGTIAVTATDVTATVGALTPSFTGSDGNTLDGFITIGNNDFRTLVEGLIQTQLIPTFTNQLPPLLESLLGATGSLLNNVSFTLDAQLGTPVTLLLNGKIDALDVVAGPAVGETPGHITVHQQIAISTANTPIHPDSRGAARVSSTPLLPPTNTASLNVLLSQDFLNTLLHSLWNSGLLEGTAKIGGLSAIVSSKVQPFVIPIPDSSSCEIDGVRCDVILQLGQLEVTLPDFSQSFAINATAGARVVVDGTTISFVIAQTPDLIVWETSATPGQLTPAAVSNLVSTLVWPQLFGAIGDKLHITLPVPDLAALGLDALSPNLTNAQLTLDVRQNAAVTAGYIGLGADLELQTPQP